MINYIKNTFILLPGIFLHFTFYSQTKPHFHFHALLVTERSKPFEFKRSSSFNYKLNRGVGAEVAMYFTKQVSPKPAYLNIGPSISQIFFYDPKIKTIEYSEPYKEKSLASAFCLNARLSVGTFSTFASGKIFTYYGQVKFGAAYVQNSFYFVDTHRGLNLTSWNTVFGIGVGFWYYNPRWWLPSIGLGIQYANLGGKHLQGFMLN